MIEINDILGIGKYEMNVDGQRFKALFGDRMGRHYWIKFRDVYHNSVIELLYWLNVEDTQKLLDDVNYYIENNDFIKLEEEEEEKTNNAWTDAWGEKDKED